MLKGEAMPGTPLPSLMSTARPVFILEDVEGNGPPGLPCESPILWWTTPALSKEVPHIASQPAAEREDRIWERLQIVDPPAANVLPSGLRSGDEV